MDAIKVALIGGSGLGAVLTGDGGMGRHEVQTPFGAPSGPILEGVWEGVPVLLLSRHGEGHLLNPSAVPYRANIWALKQLGATHVIASGAVGSLREEIRPRDLVVADQVIDKTYRRAGTFFDHSAVHVEFAQPFCPALRESVLEAAKQMEGTKVHPTGTYVCMEGPAFSSRAESLMHRLWGGDVIGMTAMPEAKLAREAELSYALIALPTDYDAWKAPKAGEEKTQAVLLEEILSNLRAASENALGLMKQTLRVIAANPDRVKNSPAFSALKLGIWSEKKRIPAEEVERLRLLWGKYF